MDCKRESDNPVVASKPNLNEEQAIKLAKTLFDLEVTRVKSLPSYDDQNFYIQVCCDGSAEFAEFVMKITNGEDSKNEELIKAQTYVMMLLHKEGLPTPNPVLTNTDKIMSLETIGNGPVPQKHMVRLLTYLPGTPAAKIVATPNILFNIGRMAAVIDETLTKKFNHSSKKSFDRGEYIWNLSNTPLLRKYVHAVKEEGLRDIIEGTIKDFETRIEPNLKHLRKCINHGDLNDHNILLEKTESVEHDEYKVSGILDFGDMSNGYYAFEVAITIMYMMIESNDPLHVGGYILAGFESLVPLTTEERDSLFTLVCCRFAQSLVIARYSVLHCPENEEYLMITARTGWKHLMNLAKTGKEAVEKIWFDTAKSYIAERHC
ncbi:hydroxylysine kinase [Pelobates cultripes]|uniref:Hydroxylysine kinase n=1 Tax=Pelobates cultripes TaxID=61616 RepID=A0AAD1RL16_PELCU|nr:hydroxylysine kinase [Pelobates cultripes]